MPPSKGTKRRTPRKPKPLKIDYVTTEERMTDYAMWGTPAPPHKDDKKQGG